MPYFLLPCLRTRTSSTCHVGFVIGGIGPENNYAFVDHIGEDVRILIRSMRFQLPRCANLFVHVILRSWRNFQLGVMIQLLPDFVAHTHTHRPHCENRQNSSVGLKCLWCVGICRTHVHHVVLFRNCVDGTGPIRTRLC